MSAARAARGVAAGAALIAAVTLLARVTGFGRWLVFSRTVGAPDGTSCLATAYQTANMLPNIVFEVVAGGALAVSVVPLVAGAAARGDEDAARRAASALLTWALLVLVPLAALGALAAGPLMRLLTGGDGACGAGDSARVAAGFFVVFAPQVALYGVAVVASGVLNARRRFLAPALAPLLSSLVVVGAYLGFQATYAGSRDDLDAVPAGALLWLSLGTTGGVAVLALTSLVPVLVRERLRPALRFPPGAARRARTLAGAGLAGLVAQQVATLAVLVAARDDPGAINVYTYAWAVYLLPYAVLAVPIATASFSALSEQAGRGDRAAFAGTAAATTRAVLLVSLLGSAVLVAAAAPTARVFGVEPAWTMAWALVAFAPGLAGQALVAHLGRALSAAGRGGAAARGTVAGWGVAAAGSILGGALLPGGWTATGVGAATSAGMLLAGALLLRSLRAAGGTAATAGAVRAGAAGLAGAVPGAAAGAGVAAGLGAALPAAGPVLSAVEAAAAGGAAALVAAGAVLLLDGDDLRPLLARLLRRTRTPAPTAEAAATRPGAPTDPGGPA
ncbi:murein biosynthesis integral membrane protein MurJ [Vallicoccus soli]|uniref:Virulence factor MviN n=1 Tax=Vallicoccus soli TaxID=2339232 RepID=A0A3A3YYJ6_9ACTN|nr:lipid II flippase MurJ [Vallicoccus soli]RJK93117.1 virulence factor MviN [Vallicoccus soli]